MENSNDQDLNRAAAEPLLPRCCSVRFRPADQPCTATTRLAEVLRHGEVVMVQTDHGLEPALLHHDYQPCGPKARMEPPPAAAEETTSNGAVRDHREGGREEPLPAFAVLRQANREEQEKFVSLQAREREAFSVGQRLIVKHRLPMKLIRVERYYNGSKIIFFFTAENRVDFRELVKDLVQEFRTRVEIRQVGVRHETKMIGGIGCCGRELCCSSYIRNFSPVSIKMAKEQGLPLNPAKISGICNRLLCCLTYEFETYQQLRRRLPKPGKQVVLDGENFKVIKVHVLEERVEVCSLDDPGRVITWQSSEWSRCEPAKGGGKPAPAEQQREKAPEQRPAKRGGGRPVNRGDKEKA